MNTKKITILITLSLLFLAACASPATPIVPDNDPIPAPANFTGHWVDPAMGFTLDLSQSADQLAGRHEIVAQGGNKIDALDNSIKGSVQADKANVTFQSSFTAETGTAQITYIDENTIFWKIVTPPNGEFYLPTDVSLKKVAANLVPTESAVSDYGVIAGTVHLLAPPTPRMVIYAVDSFTGSWRFVETEPIDGEAQFSISVPPGTYIVFGAAAEATTTAVGYTTDEVTLAIVTVAPSQTTAGITVRPPSLNECGAMMAYPASPDGRFAASPAPGENCAAPATTSSGAYVPVTLEVCQTLQELATQSSGFTFGLQPSVPFQAPMSTEMGHACELTAISNGAAITDSVALLNTLKNGFYGWTEYPPFASGGPMGMGVAMTRDSALLMISVTWLPSPEANCPTDQPISDCPLTPEQKLYTISIRAAMQ